MARLLGTDEIKISATREDTEPFRLIRLHRIVGYIGALSDVIGYDVIERIAGLHDHKGELTVTWRQEPSDAEKGLVTKAWAGRIGDGAPNVTHVIAPPGEGDSVATPAGKNAEGGNS